MRSGGANVVIRGGQIVLGERLTRGDLFIRDGRIVGILPPGEPVPDARPLDVDGLIVLPGLVDIHTHLRDPGHTHKEDFASGTAAAAAGGFTTVVAQPNTDPPLASPDALKRARTVGSAHAVVDFGLAALARPGCAADLTSLREHGALFFEIYRADAPDPWLVREAAALYPLLEAAASLQAPVAVYAVDQGLVEIFTTRARATGMPDAQAFLSGRPPIVETSGLVALMDMFRATGGRLLLRQVTTAAGVECIRRARASGQRDLWAEVNPHHLFLNSQDAQDLGSWSKVAPPLRDQGDVNALWSGLMDGTLDLVGTDHAPHTAAERTSGDFWSIPPGLPGLETTLPLFASSAAAMKIGFNAIARWLSEAPARFAGLYPRKGSLLPGADADVVLVDPDAQWIIDPTRLLTKAGWTPFAGRRVQGRVVATLVRGIQVFHDGNVRVPPGYGRFLAPGRLM